MGAGDHEQTAPLATLTLLERSLESLDETLDKPSLERAYLSSPPSPILAVSTPLLPSSAGLAWLCLSLPPRALVRSTRPEV